MQVFFFYYPFFLLVYRWGLHLLDSGRVSLNVCNYFLAVLLPDFRTSTYFELSKIH